MALHFFFLQILPFPPRPPPPPPPPPTRSTGPSLKDASKINGVFNLSGCASMDLGTKVVQRLSGTIGNQLDRYSPTQAHNTLTARTTLGPRLWKARPCCLSIDCSWGKSACKTRGRNAQGLWSNFEIEGAH